MSVLRQAGYYRGGRTTGAMPNGDFLGPEAYPPGTYPAPTGVVIDGALCQLEGEPPIARPGSWGDLSWSRRRWF